MHTFETILLIDDDGISNFITEKLILREQLARQVISFLSAEEALVYLNRSTAAACTANFPDIILLDLNMPAMNGWEFIEAYKNLPQPESAQCRLYMLSSAVDAKDIVQAKSISLVQDFISKPLTKEDIDIMRERHTGEAPNHSDENILG